MYIAQDRGSRVHRLVPCLTTAFVLASGIGASAAWYDPSWLHRKAVAINGGLCGASPCIAGSLTDFPVLISLSSDAELATGAQDDGDDIVFTASDGSTQLDHEIESFDGATGALAVWVRLPSLPAGVNTTIYLYYGNGAAANQESPANVWEASHRGVWHLSEDPSLSQALDSTSHGNHGSPLGSMTSTDQVPGRIAGALDFDGLDDRLDAGSAASLDDLGPLTVSAWIRPTEVPGSAGKIAAKYQAAAPGGRWFLEVDDSAPEDDALQFLKGHQTTNLQVGSTSGIVSYASWQHVAATWNGGSGTTDVRLYRNGTEVVYGGAVAGVGPAESDESASLLIGAVDDATQLFTGLIDEVRVSSVVRAPEWIRTEHNNGAHQGVGADKFLLSLGFEEMGTCGSNLVMVTGDGTFSSSEDAARKALFESWGYNVTALAEGATQLEYDAAAAANDVMFLASSTTTSTVGTRARGLNVGIVSERSTNWTRLFFDSGSSSASASGGTAPTEMEVLDNAHYITSPYPLGDVVIAPGLANVDEWPDAVSLPPGAQVLGLFEGIATKDMLIVADVGAALIGGTPAPERRVLFGTGATPFSEWTADLKALVERSLAWANCGGGPIPPPPPHFSVSHDGANDFCTAEPVTITRHDGSHAVDASYTGTITLSTSSGNGTWTVLGGSGVLNDSVAGDGAATYTYAAADQGSVVLGFSSSVRETLSIGVTDGSSGTWSAENPELELGVVARDQFLDPSYTGSDGTIPWSGPWTEINESDGPAAGSVIVGSSGTFVLEIFGGGSQTGVYREVSLSGATAATLFFDYRRRSLSDANDFVTVSASADGGATWTELLPRVLMGAANDTFFQSTSYDLTSYVSDRTQIRFQAASTLGPGDHVEIDDVRIEADGACFVTTNVRSIGAGKASPDSTGTVAATRGSTTVTGSGAQQWLTGAVRRGAGDVISIEGTPYTVASVVSDTALRLRSPFLGATGSGKAYLLDRHEATLTAWENCVDGGPCSYFGAGLTASLVTDNRREVGVAYDDAVFNERLTFDGSTTDAGHDITLTVEPSQRHSGTAASGVTIDNDGTGGDAIDVRDDHVTIEWLVIRDGDSLRNGVRLSSLSGGGNNQVVIRGCVFENIAASAIEVVDADARADLYNNVINGPQRGIDLPTLSGTSSRVRIWNNTIYNATFQGMNSASAGDPTVTVENNLVLNSASADYTIVPGTARNNTSSDGTAPGSDPHTFVTPASVLVAPGTDHHLRASPEVDAGVGVSEFTLDVDGQERPAGAGWDRGADELGAVTAVELVSFEARPLDRAVELRWETSSELNNLGFHLYRSTRGGYHRITERLIPGLGSSPSGAEYRYRDANVVNGATYGYLLEDVETTGRSKRHGPVSTTPSAGLASKPPPVEEADLEARLLYGEPEKSAFRTERRKNGVVLILETGGFEAIPQEDGTVRLEVPGLEEASGSSLPVKRTWLEAVSGREVEIVSVSAREVERFEGLRPSASLEPELVGSSRGTVRARSRRGAGSALRREGARLLEVGYQGQTKKALLELSPFTWKGEALVLARKLEVHVAFRGREARSRRSRHAMEKAVVRLATVEKGLYGIPLRELVGHRGPGSLRLSRSGETVAYHVEGDVLYFWSEGASANPYGQEAVYELSVGMSGRTMEVASSGGGAHFHWQELEREENRYYQAGLLDAPDPWLWELLFAPERKSFSFEVSDLAEVPQSSRLTLWVQGTSDFPGVEDHHVRVYVNGSLVAESRWDGKKAREIEAELGAGVLREGANELELENVGNTGAAYSMVMLDRFRLRYPRTLSGLRSARYVLDVAERVPRWIASRDAFEPERAYVAVDEVLRPELRRVFSSRLPRAAEYLAIGPEAFVEAAASLVHHRKRQGLRVATATTAAIASEMGHGELTPDAIRDYVAEVYREGGLRYVLLLGDATYDFKDYQGTGAPNHVPPYMVRTSYLWTASDPAYAAVNGEDLLPDVAIGRLPARTAEELQTMVAKILAYENGELSRTGAFVLVADDADRAGNFPADAEEIAKTVLAGRETKRIYLSELGAPAAREAIVESFDEGASAMSYVGHGGIHLWADENLFQTEDVERLSRQSRQPVLFTMNCLNGYFHFPYFDSLAEALLKPRDKGVIAAFSPSGLSLNAPAHLYHQALLRELASGGHSRLGDALLAAQKRYADTGALPELLAIYHLFGDPALELNGIARSR